MVSPTNTSADKSEVQDFFKPVLKRLEDEGLLINPFQYNFNTYTPPNYCIMVR